MQGRLGQTLAVVKQVSYDWCVLQRDYPDQVCSIARSLEVIGERWTLLILRDALVGLTRFEEFQAKLGIASNVLTKRLKRLCDEELFERVPDPERTRPAEVRAHRRTRARPRPDRADEMGRPPLPDPRRPTPTHAPRRLRRQHRPRPPLRSVRRIRGARRRSSSRPAQERRTRSTPDGEHRPRRAGPGTLPQSGVRDNVVPRWGCRG